MNDRDTHPAACAREDCGHKLSSHLATTSPSTFAGLIGACSREECACPDYVLPPERVSAG